MALAMRDVVRDLSRELPFPDGVVPELRLRIGIHAGPPSPVSSILKSSPTTSGPTPSTSLAAWNPTANPTASTTPPLSIPASGDPFSERGEIAMMGKGRRPT